MAVSLVGHALCSISDVKLRLPSEQSDQTDALLARLINSFSTQAEQYTSRQFEIKSRTITPDGLTGGGQQLSDLLLPAYPILEDPAPQVWEDELRTFGATSLLTENSDYVVVYENGIIRRIANTILAEHQPSFSYFGSGLDRPRGFAADASWDYGRKTIKITWTGGIVTPRTAAPATPSVATNGAGSLNGSYRYAYSVIDSDGNESVVSTEIAATASNNTLRLTYTDPGAGSTVRIYRTQEGYSVLYHLTDIAGGAGTTYDDNVSDGSLDTGVVPYGSGPRVVPDDLLEACAMQVVDWAGRSQEPGIVRISQSGSGVMGGTATFRDRGTFIPYVQMVLDSYRP